jgi:hypothetical protein
MARIQRSAEKPIIGRHQNLVGDGQLTEGSTAGAAAEASDMPVMKVLLDGGADATLTLANRARRRFWQLAARRASRRRSKP